MRLIIYFTLLLLSVLQCSVQASELLKMARIDTKDVVHIYFSFDKTPQFTSAQYDRRIDLEFFQTTQSPKVSLGEPDNDIVKILPRPGEDRYILSLFFRYRPQQYKLTKSSDGNLVFEVLLGNQYSKSYQDMADRLKGITVLERLSLNSSNPYQMSPYAKDWMSFFSQYESPLTIKAPVKFSSPPFPIIDLLPPGGETNLQILKPEMFELARLNLWDDLAEQLLASIQTTADLETLKLLALTYGEALTRGGHFEDAFKQLFLLSDKYSDELLSTYAEYLLIYLRSVYENPYIADSEYRLLEPAINNSLPLAPYLRLSQIETALASGNYVRLNHLLQRDDVAYPPYIEDIVKIRQADYWYAIQQGIKARAAYQLLADSPELQTLPYSLSGFCNVAYDQKKFEEAATCYDTLSHLVTEENLLGLIKYKKNMARLHINDKAKLIDEFREIENDFPNTEAAYRAAIKRNDLLFLKNKTWGRQAIDNYGAIAQNSISRSIREEALFKQALVSSILGDNTESVQLLQKYLREFLTGDVRISAQALLIDILPGVIKQLVEDHDYIQPLVLAKQNKELFQNQWIDNTFLVSVAEAYHRIGIYDEAQKLYLYLIGIVPVDQKEDLFLPMIQATFDHGNYTLVEDYAAEYTYTYPNGRYADQILFLRLQALVADERLSDATRLLPDPLPENRQIYELAASLFFRIDNYQKSLEVLQKMVHMKTPLSQKEQFMYAESLYRTGEFEEAEKVFMAVTKESEFYQQSLYRLTELARQKGDEKKALSLFEKLVETENNSLWKQYAERELQFAKAAARM
jgi:hypothetical protein